MFTVQPITAAQITTLTSELAAQNTQITPGAENQYAITGHGITASAVFDPAKGSLTVTVIHKPFYIPESAIESGIQNALKAIA